MPASLRPRRARCSRSGRPSWRPRSPPTTVVSIRTTTSRRGAAVAHLSRPDPFAIARAPRDWSLPAATALSMRMSLFPPTAAPWGIAGSFDHDTPGIAPRRSATLVDALLGLEDDARPRAPARARRASSAWSRSIRAASSTCRSSPSATPSSPSPRACSRSPARGPRAYAVGAAVVAGDDAEALRIMLDPAFDPQPDRRARARAGDPGGGPWRSPPPSASSASARTGCASPPTRRRPGYVVLADAWAPGWTARVDGHEERVLRANVAFRAVAVPAGHHDVDLRYRAPGLSLGLAVSAVSLAGLLAAAVRSRRGRSRGREHVMSVERLAEHARIWRDKPELRLVYSVWFDALLSEAPAGSRVIEVGAGPGVFARVRASAPRPDLVWVSHGPGPRPVERRRGRRALPPVRRGVRRPRPGRRHPPPPRAPACVLRRGRARPSTGRPAGHRRALGDAAVVRRLSLLPPGGLRPARRPVGAVRGDGRQGSLRRERRRPARDRAYDGRRRSGAGWAWSRRRRT